MQQLSVEFEDRDDAYIERPVKRDKECGRRVMPPQRQGVHQSEDDYSYPDLDVTREAPSRRTNGGYRPSGGERPDGRTSERIRRGDNREQMQQLSVEFEEPEAA